MQRCLGEKVDVAGKWCYEMGAESLGDLEGENYAEELAERLAPILASEPHTVPSPIALPAALPAARLAVMPQCDRGDMAGGASKARRSTPAACQLSRKMSFAQISQS